MQSFKVPLNSNLDESTYIKIYQAAKKRNHEFLNVLEHSVKEILITDHLSPLAQLAREKDIESVNFVLGFLNNLSHTVYASPACAFGYAEASCTEEIDKILLHAETEKSLNYFLYVVIRGLLSAQNTELARHYINKNNTLTLKIVRLFFIASIKEENSNFAFYILTFIDDEKILLRSAIELCFQWAANNKDFKKFKATLDSYDIIFKDSMLDALVRSYTSNGYLEKTDEILKTASTQEEATRLLGHKISALSSQGKDNEIKKIFVSVNKKNIQRLKFFQGLGLIGSKKYAAALQLSLDFKLTEKENNLQKELCYELVRNHNFNFKDEKKILELLTLFSILQAESLLKTIKEMIHTDNKIKNVTIDLDFEIINKVESKFYQMKKKAKLHQFSLAQSYLLLEQQEIFFWTLKACTTKNLPKALIFYVISFFLNVSLTNNEMMIFSNKLYVLFGKKPISEKSRVNSQGNIIKKEIKPIQEQQANPEISERKLPESVKLYQLRSFIQPLLFQKPKPNQKRQLHDKPKFKF